MPLDRRPRIQPCDVAIVGAGPYGLAAAAHLRGLDRLDVRIFGEPMSFWDAMPRGLLLRAPAEIGSPHADLTLRSYEKANNTELQRPAPLAEFIRYGRWFQQRAVPEVDRRRVALVTWVDGGFELELDDGASLTATRVVIAAGMESFAFRPPLFDELPAWRRSRTPPTFTISDGLPMRGSSSSAVARARWSRPRCSTRRGRR